jgi:hypothetical protein
MGYKLTCSALAIALTFIAFVPYIRSILAGRTKPHVFSWVIWGITTVIVFFAQLEAKGGMGAWPTGVSGTITILIAVLAFIHRSDISITLTDRVFFLAALASLPFWFYTADPLWAVVVLTTVDLLGFGPTLRKAYAFPHEENIAFFFLFMTRNTFAILALEHFSVTTVLFPLAVGLACLLLIFVVGYRRHEVRA